MLDSLAGLSVGDAFGEHLLSRLEYIPVRLIGDPPWGWTDDTEMALALVAVLQKYGRVHQDDLARSFGEGCDPKRRYGPAMLVELLPRLRSGENWQIAAKALFGGEGSYGNGAAMRVAPLGAFLADDLATVTEEAHRSAEVTHTHAEGIAGAIAVAVAAAFAARQRIRPTIGGPRTFIDAIIPHVPESEVRRGLILLYEQLGPRANLAKAASLVGNGSLVSAADTVPLCLWAAGSHLNDYESALWETAGVLGDMDTNCAIVGGIVAACVGASAIPAEWLQRREPLPCWGSSADADACESP